MNTMKHSGAGCLGTRPQTDAVTRVFKARPLPQGLGVSEAPVARACEISAPK